MHTFVIRVDICDGVRINRSDCIIQSIVCKMSQSIQINNRPTTLSRRITSCSVTIIPSVVSSFKRITKYYGKCARCGTTPSNTRWRSNRTGSALPPECKGDHRLAPNQSNINNRVCEPCRHLIRRKIYVEIDRNVVISDNDDDKLTSTCESQLEPLLHVSAEDYVDSTIITPSSRLANATSTSSDVHSSSSDWNSLVTRVLHRAFHTSLPSSLVLPIVASHVPPVIATIIPETSASANSSGSSSKQSITRKRAQSAVVEEALSDGQVIKKPKVLRNHISVCNRDKRKYVNMYRAGTLVLDGSNTQRQRMRRWCRAIDKIDSLPLKERISESRSRNDGGGCKPLLAEVEKDIKQWVLKQRKGDVAFSVSVMSIIAYAQETYLLNSARTLTYNWVGGFMIRNRLSFRRGTTNKRIEINQDVVAQYRINEHEDVFSKIDLRHVYNMDETGVNFDTAARCTVDETGTSSVPINTSGHERSRSTVVLVLSAIGMKLPPVVIHRHAMPKLNAEGSNQQALDKATLRHQTITAKNISIDVVNSKGETEKKDVKIFECENPCAWMNGVVMGLWIESVFDEYSQLANTQRVLYMDNMSAHATSEINEQAKACNIDVRMLPPNCTPLLQPLDHAINGLFKRALHKQWLRWFQKLVASGEEGKTRAGNWKIATRDDFNEWVALAWESITAEAIVNAFEHSLTGSKTLKTARDRLAGKDPVFIRPAANRASPAILAHEESEQISQREMVEFDEMLTNSVTLDHLECDSDNDSDYIEESDEQSSNE